MLFIVFMAKLLVTMTLNAGRWLNVHLCAVGQAVRANSYLDPALALKGKEPKSVHVIRVIRPIGLMSPILTEIPGRGGFPILMSPLPIRA
jgi:hypothetical protein